MYDAVVIGTDISSHLAALTCLAGRKKTLLVYPGERETYSADGFSFSLETYPLFYSGLSLIPDSWFEKKYEPLDPGLQFISADHRIELFVQNELYLKELEREFPGESGNVRRFVTAVDQLGSRQGGLVQDSGLFSEGLLGRLKRVRKIPRLMADFWTFRGILNPIKDTDFRALLRAQISSRSGCPGSFHILTPYLLFSRQICYYEGGHSGLLSGMLKIFRDFGGAFSYAASIKKVFLKDICLDFGQGGETFSAGKLILSTRLLNAPWLSGTGLENLSPKYFAGPDKYFPFTLYLGVDERCLPEMLGNHAVLSGGNGNGEHNEFVFLSTSRHSDTRLAPHGKRTLSVTRYLKTPPPDAGRDALETAGNEILSTVTTFLPFLRDGVEHFELNRSIENYKKGILAHRLAGNGNSIRHAWGNPHRTALKDVFLTGPSMFPLYGGEGEIISGLKAARYALED